MRPRRRKPWWRPAGRLTRCRCRAELYRQVGCSACSKTGYKGRLALHEVMAVTEGIERLAVTRASGEDMGRLAREQGMQTLRDDGLAKVALGLTTLEEIFRVVV